MEASFLPKLVPEQKWTRKLLAELPDDKPCSTEAGYSPPQVGKEMAR